MEIELEKPKSHHINEVRKQNFIEGCDENVREYVRKIIDNTTHISFDKFLEKFESYKFIKIIFCLFY